MNRTLNAFLALIPLAAALAVAAGLALGSDGHGFALLLLDSVRRLLGATLLGALAFCAVYSLLRRLLERWGPRPGLAVAMAAGVTALPFVALAGYHLNRSLAVKPSEILEPWALTSNLILLAGCGVAYGVAAVTIAAAEERPRRLPWWPLALSVLAWAALHLGLARAFAAPAKDDHPDVLVLLVDALRADELGVYGYGRDTSPAIDALAADGVVFRQAISQSTFTKTSIASLFTGKNPYRHGIYHGQRQLTDGYAADVLDEDERTLAESLLRRGYLTGAWVQNSHLREVMGFGQGFVEYHDQQGHIDRIHAASRYFFDGPARRYSFFAYLHYIDLHDPYRPSPPYDTMFFNGNNNVYDGVDFAEWGTWLRGVREGEIALTDADVEELRAYYDGQLRYVDDEIGRLMERLKDAGLYDDTLIILTADHGDAFMEHGFVSHSWTPYDELLRVPLIVKFPGKRHAGTVIEDQVRLVDVMPTVLAAAGAPVPPNLDGCDLLPLLEGETLDGDCALAISEIADDNEKPTIALRLGSVKYIHQSDAPDELYDLDADPGETSNLVDERPEEAAALLRIATEIAGKRRQDVKQRELGGQAIDELKALGYIGGDAPPPPEKEEGSDR